MTEDAIVAVEIQETEYGEKVAVQLPFDSKDFVKSLPFMEYGSYDNYRAEMESNNIADGAMQAAEDFGFSSDFASYRVWEPNAFGYDDGAWLVGVDGWDEASDYFEFCEFEVEERANL